MADVNTSLASSALAKISSGTPLDKLDPTEKQAIGALPPGALQAAMSSRIAPKPPNAGGYPSNSAPKPSPISGAYPSMEPAPASMARPKDDSSMASAANKAGLVEVPGYKPPKTGPLAGRTYQNVGGMSIPVLNSDMNYEGFERMRAKALPAGDPNFSTGPIIAGMRNPYAKEQLSLDAMSAASPIADTSGPALPSPPPAITTPTAKAETSPVISKNAGGYPAYTPESSFPVIQKGMDKAKLADIISAVMDAVGGGMRAYGGTNAPTKLMREGELSMQAKAAQQQAKATADIEFEQAKRLMPLEVQTAAEIAKATGDWETFYAIAKQQGVQDMEIAKIKAAAQAGLGYNPYAGAVNAVKGSK